MAMIRAYFNSGQSHPSELRIVLIGGREFRGEPSKKSASGNIILGKSVFDTSRRTAQSVVEQGVVHGRKVTVVDTPGWWCHYPLENTPELDQIEIMNSVYQCSPGPHAFLLVIPVPSCFLQIFKLSLEEHLQLFHDMDVFNHTIVLFTAETPCSDETLSDMISYWPALEEVLEQCGNRKHVFNINNTQDTSQVVTLFKKIEAMVAKNGGGHCSIDSAAGNALREKMQELAEQASKRSGEVQEQRRKLKTLIEDGKTPPAHLRLVMVGAQWSAKSSAGNTILGKRVFAVKQRRTTNYCEINHGLVAERNLTVVDSPGWFYNHTLQDTSETDKLELQRSVYLCSPGPHAVFLVVGLASAFNSSYQRAVQEHMSLFTDEIWRYTIVVFTRGEWLGAKSVEERIESEEHLKWLVEKCGNRYHVLNNKNSSDKTQVTELLEKVEEMWAGNKDPHYEVDPSQAQQIELIKEARDKMAEWIRQTTQRQTTILRELYKGERQITDQRIVLLGRKESGKSMAGVKLFCQELFDTALKKKEFQCSRETRMCVKHKRNVAGVNTTLVEVPGWLTDTIIPDWLKGEVLCSVSLCAPGPHVFLLVIPICKAFTEDDCRAVVELLKPFSERVWRHCMVLFTWGDWLNNRSIEEHIAGEGEALQWLVEKCGNRYQVVSFYHFPVMELFQKITDLIARNKGHCFTNEDGEGNMLKFPWQFKQPVLTEVEWNRREQELVDRMLKVERMLKEQEPEESVPFVEMSASLCGDRPNMSGSIPSECGRRRAHAVVSEWLNTRAGCSDITSGIDDMSASASYVEKPDESPLPDESQPVSWLLSGKYKMKFDTVPESHVSPDIFETRRRYSC